MLLLDTNALLWLSGGSERLGPVARAAIEAAVDDAAAAFSAISVWEAATLVRKGRYALGQTVEGWRADLIAAGLAEAPLEGLAAAMAGALTSLHDDPADRFIAATALRLGASLVTSDQRLLDWASRAGGAAGLDARI
jgi:PIN domain nuclease of toxin-antitoxin system